MKRLVLLFLFAFILTACANEPIRGEAVSGSAITATATLTHTSEPSSTQQLTNTPVPSATFPATSTPAPQTATSIPTRTKVPTKTATEQPSPTPTAMLVGTQLPTSAQILGLDNYQKIARVAQWGRGSIFGAAFSPDDNHFVVGSAFGYAIYDVQNPDASPHWVSFDQPFFYENLFFDSEGEYILLQNNQGYYETPENFEKVHITSFQNEQFITAPSNVTWLKTTQLTENWGSQTLTSPDGQLEFKSSVTHDEEFWDIEFSIREIFDTRTNEIQYQLSDETIQVNFDDHHEPEGCDLRTFSMCGNVYSPSASLPYRVGFSPDGSTLAILYRPPNLWNTNRFSTLRVYDLSDGSLYTMIGSFEHPVETFAYSSSGDTLLIGYVDGLVELWDIAQKDIVFSARSFNAPIIDLEYSFDGKYLVIQRPGTLEIRRAKDGLVRGRYEAVASAISPVDYKIAVGTLSGDIHVFDMDSGVTEWRIEGHEGEVRALTFSPDGKILVSSGQDCAVRSWNVETGEYQHPFEENWTNAYGEDFTESRIFIDYVNFIPGTNQLVGYGSWSRVVSWNANSGATQYLIEPEPLDYWQGMVTLNPHWPEFFSVNPDGSSFYIDYAEYDLGTGERLGEYQKPVGLPEGCSASGPYSKDGELRFTIGIGEREGQICMLDAVNYQLLHVIDVLPEIANYELYIDWLYLSPDGKQLIVTLAGGQIQVYQTTP